ncbi:glycosyl hydrolase family 28-related protein [Luteibacter sp. RCC_6_2]|uniref:glycosyl hydrolase family 28-related protein n=1 Tax=Luteibacter sp. RCC_6_2 TaxID=3239223 RepID=UPI0035258571
MKRRDFVSMMPAVAVGVTAISSAAQAATSATNATTRYANVMDFGAVGDGIHDDTAAIQTAISSLSATGGGVYLPPGTYVVSSTIALIPNLTLSGFGSKSVKILPKTTGITVLQYLSDSSQPANISIHGLEVDCTSVPDITGINCRLSDHLSVTEVIFSGCSYSIQLDRCRYVEIQNCISRGSPWNKAGTLKLFSATVTEYIHEVKVTNYHAINIGNGIANGHAIIVHRGVANLIDGFLLNDGHVGGDVHAVGFYGDCQGCKVSNSGVGACAGGIFFGKDIYFSSNSIVPSFAVISSVDIDQPQVAGIWMAACNWITILGGNFTSSNANTSATGILVQTGSMITISNVTINGFSNGNGVLIGAGVSNITVSQCQVDQCGTGLGVVNGNGRNLSLMGNRLTGNTNAILFGATGGGSLVRNNIGTSDLA